MIDKTTWWWIDRWRKSSAYTDMTAEQQGLYRNLLDEIWLRADHTIPDDPRILAKVSGDAEAWQRSGAIVLKWMVRTDAGWTHPTALQVIHQSRDLSLRRSEAGKLGNKTRWQEHRKEHRKTVANGIANGIAKLSQTVSQTVSPPSPDPSPLLNPSQSTADQENQDPPEVAKTRKLGGVNGRGDKLPPIWKGQRFVVFDWQLESLTRLLGDATAEFDLHDWFFKLDEIMRKNGELIPQRDGGEWLEAQTLAEAQRRGLHVAIPVSQRFGKQTTRLMQAVQRIQHEEARKRDAG
jgi:uncharacterized protein YdaU (DUF1376 family)